MSQREAQRLGVLREVVGGGMAVKAAAAALVEASKPAPAKRGSCNLARPRIRRARPCNC